MNEPRPLQMLIAGWCCGMLTMAAIVGLARTFGWGGLSWT